MIGYSITSMHSFEAAGKLKASICRIKDESPDVSQNKKCTTDYRKLDRLQASTFPHFPCFLFDTLEGERG